MPRIAGVNIPDEKRIEVALTYIFGIGPSRGREILVKAKISPDKRAGQLNADEVNALKKAVEGDYKVEGDLKRQIMLNIKRLKDIASYRGSRHSRGLPARGQRTKTNTRTVRGNVRRTMGSGKVKIDKK
ncbi:MAG: 30S ribosomal protein S13 [Candidatus Portnoybacteria bacterium CG10_big_fil_rev_8_21_14_0_10_44_7]|uniref:Small ribosomal subunit protein uS13 n=1 Tax=Candidatus Portnoybacteria bacterium CG10_big_fil_rev_8_21_14_0_10_44_7 TaxID=1974816 RepID=A0A2M8KJA5_9BACT|nr:MAG: 30S ribosomal protein S13 [Candidatus Portnoybacteria bacterium CG10_big_fil_rev_8_21_14_0_10_44_7]